MILEIQNDDLSTSPVRDASAATLSAAVLPNGVLLTTRPGEWSVIDTPAVNVQAAATKAAGGAGVRHVATGVFASLAVTTALAAGALLSVQIRDGVTPLWYGYIEVPNGAVVGQVFKCYVNGLNLVGSANTAMNAQYGGAQASCQQAITLTEYSTP